MFLFIINTVVVEVNEFFYLGSININIKMEREDNDCDSQAFRTLTNF